MKESSTYQAIVEEGRVEGIARGMAQGAVEEAKKLLRMIGEQAFGAPDAATLDAIERLNDLGKLEELLRRVRMAGGWRELFGRLTAARKSGRRPGV